MAHTVETDVFFTNKKTKSSSTTNDCFSTWWNQNFSQQKYICRIIESFLFRALAIFLVVLDISLIIGEIILDSFKIHYECEKENSHLFKHHDKIIYERIELTMKIIHYASIAILLFFVIELFVKIYSFGKEFWNIHRKKMEYFDAFIVITSLIIDLYFLRGEEKILGKRSILILSFRLWRFVRIISSVGEGIRDGQIKHKERLNKEYLIAVHRLIDLLIHKTNSIEQYENNDKTNLTPILEHFHMIDNQCKSSLDHLDENHLLPTSVIVKKFTEQLNGLENESDHSVISAMFVKPSEV